MISNLHSELKPHLEPHESLLWTGKPKAGIVFRQADIFLIPFSIIWCGFAIFWFLMAAQAGIFALFGIPFIGVGLFFVFGRFLIDAKQRESTTYGITEDRILIRSGVFSKNLQSLKISTLSQMDFTESKNGFGTISFGPKNPMMIWGNSMNWWPGMNTGAQLELIPNVHKVYRQINELQ